MGRYTINVVHKRQTKMFDCWYACIQMLLSTRFGEKMNPFGNAVAEHRSRKIIGRKLSFDKPAGDAIMEQNGLVVAARYVSSSGTTAEEVERGLRIHGPIIVGGKFGPLGAGHFIALCGVDTDTEMLQFEDPGWFKGNYWKPLDHLGKMWVKPEAAVTLPPIAG
jgi:hypothetical protein